MTEPLIEITNLQTHFFTDEGVVKAVENVSLTIPKGETLGLVGESGCGKSVTALSVIRLISSPGRIVGGSITLHQDDGPVELTTLSEPEMRKLRGSTIAMIFQEPMTSLNPVFTVGAQIMEAIRLHQKVDKAEARNRAIEMLRKVKVPAPEQRIKEYPHQFSGGMRQRVMIAMALSCNPRLLIADEPTTALDVTIQAQILDLLHELQEETDMSILLITHDLGIIAEVASEVAVMYASKIVEQAPVAELFSNPRHPYTHGLFASKLTPEVKRGARLVSIDGMVPSPLQFPRGCKFHPRCPYQQERCQSEEPQLREFAPDHIARCHYVEEIDYEQ
ncbi:MAG: ABC transporter ATP-binding protein [Planctomycetota bacterium]|nr:ABC transporter ATP-binding protein [Planctomycetota bacterium]